jgi:hypothetical protein
MLQLSFSHPIYFSIACVLDLNYLIGLEVHSRTKTNLGCVWLESEVELSDSILIFQNGMTLFRI